MMLSHVNQNIYCGETGGSYRATYQQHQEKTGLLTTSGRLLQVLSTTSDFAQPRLIDKQRLNNEFDDSGFGQG